jgi:hypothetical protein
MTGRLLEKLFRNRNHRYLTSLILIGCSICFNQCKKNVPAPGLPAITEQGKNSFGFKLNGNTWVPYRDCGWFSGPTGALNFYSTRDSVGNYTWPLGFELSAQRVSATSTSYFKMNTRFSLYPYPSYISHTGNIFDSLEISFQKESCCDTYLSFPFYSPGSVIVTKLDTVNKIISGTFSFNLYTYIGQDLDSVVITDGRFDLKFDASICY